VILTNNEGSVLLAAYNLRNKLFIVCLFLA